jgi:hypothetical protein
MEPLRNLALGDLSRARCRRVDRALSAPAGELAAGSGRAPSHERVNRAFGAGQYSDTPGYPGRGPVYDLDVHRTADDRAVEAVLASVKEPCTAQQLATGLGWTLDRTVDALQRLEASLANTGRVLTRLGHHSYTLGPRPGLVNDREIARCVRHHREPLDLTAAAVLHCALTCPREDRARGALRSPAEHAAAERLIAAGLLEDDHGVLRPTPRAEATFQAPPDRRHLR